MDQKFKRSKCSNLMFHHQKDFGGFSWPRRNFTCNFCNKEYKSAQALGGHMNVHRRDKARLGLSSPPASLDPRHPNPNPNPNNYMVSSSSPVRFLPYNNTTSTTSHSSSIFPTTNTKKEQHKLPTTLFTCSRRAMEDGSEEEEEQERGNGTRVVWNKYEILNMEMEMGLLKDGNIELDLELRLGRS